MPKIPHSDTFLRARAESGPWLRKDSATRRDAGSRQSKVSNAATLGLSSSTLDVALPVTEWPRNIFEPAVVLVSAARSQTFPYRI